MEPVYRGEIYYADLSPVVGSEQGGIRPVLIIQNNAGNIHSTTVIVASLTTQMDKGNFPTHIGLSPEESGLMKRSVVLLEQIRTIDKKRLRNYVGKVNERTLKKINKAILISMGIYKVD